MADDAPITLEVLRSELQTVLAATLSVAMTPIYDQLGTMEKRLGAMDERLDAIDRRPYGSREGTGPTSKRRTCAKEGARWQRR